jgi:hypothetical protein
MLVLNLACGLDHRFEGWFGSNDDFDSQLKRELIACPICASTRIQRLPSAPRLNIAHGRGDPAAPLDQQPKAALDKHPERQAEQQAHAMQAAVREVLARTEDVGERFAEEARRIHYGEAAERGIRGRASAAETAELAEEGIAVTLLPELLAPKGPLQ